MRLRVGRQQHRGMDLDRQQVSNRVGVLAPVQPMQIGGTSRIGPGAGGAVQFLFDQEATVS